jgi:hypothetical protein
MDSDSFLAQRAKTKLEDLTDPDVAALSHEQKEVLIALRRHFGNWNGAPKIDSHGHIWYAVYFKDAKPRGMDGRHLVKGMRALEKAGLFVRTGSYAFRGSNDGAPYRETDPNGWIRVVD